MRRTRRWAVGLSWSIALAGCSPALDWRDARMEGPALQATFPCRPVAQTRQVELAGRPMAMQLHACEAAGHTFAVSGADVGDPSAVGPALRALHQASLSKAAAPGAIPVADWPVPQGATPHAEAGRWQLRVVGPGGTGLTMDTAVFARGTWVLQASVIGPEPATGGVAAQAPFFEGLRFAP